MQLYQNCKRIKKESHNWIVAEAYYTGWVNKYMVRLVCSNCAKTKRMKYADWHAIESYREGAQYKK